ncbi:zinc finger protein on ecdysone puffs, partial [Asbolus verrucosus]
LKVIMANRRLGGMGGPQRGNRSFSQHQPFQGNNVSPWQGNMPSNNSLNQSGLLGQLAANPQQLALALTNLLQPQQQQMNNPPSLLSLNTSPAFSHQDSRDSFSRFGNRGRSDFRRNEPYNKNRNGGWRQLDSNKNAPNRNRMPFGGRDNRKRSPAKPKFIKDEKRKPEKKEDKPVDGKIDTIDLSLEDNRDDDGAEETKRGWKEEKKTGDDKKEEEQQDDPEDKKKEENRDLDGKYFGVPQKFLHCFVCNKDMWDGESFQKHIRGRAHKQMLQSLEESFHITVNILRENMRLSEEKKVIELNRMHRLSKNKFSRKFQEPESHCNMCDLKFLGKIITHRKTDGHQRLKRFLHPNCDICGKEFPSRMDWVDHRLTPEHLRQLNETLEAKVGEEGEIIEEELEIDLEPLLEESMEMEEENPILELTDDLNNIQNRMPAYKKSRAVATQSLKPFTGFMCDICHRSFENEENAQGHLRTEGHYYAFVEAAKLRFKKQSEEAAAKDNENKKRKREEESEGAAKEEVADENSQNGNEDMYDPEEACNEEDDNVKGEQEEEIVKDEPAPVVEKEAKKEEEVQQSPVANSSPRMTRRTGGAVKNGAGPKSKKARKQ